MTKPTQLDFCTIILVVTMVVAWPVIILAWLGWLPDAWRQVMSIAAGIVFLVNVPLLVRDVARKLREAKQ